MLAGGSLREALRDLLRRGLDGRAGLDDLADRARRMRQRARRRGDLDGTLDQVRAAARPGPRRRAGHPRRPGRRRRPARRDGAGDLPDDAAGRCGSWPTTTGSRRGPGGVPADPGQAAQRGARAAVRRAEAGARAAGDPAGDAGRPGHAGRPQRRCWPRTPAARTPTDQFAEFMGKHGDFFPEQPQDVDELIDALARRQAAAERLMRSLSPGAARGAGPADERGPRRRRLAAEMAQLSDNLRALRPDLDRAGRSAMQPGGQSARATARRSRRVAELADLDALEQQLAQEHAGATLDDVDVERLEQRLGSAAAATCGAAGAGARAAPAGLGHPGRRRAAPHPEALRRLGETALQAGLRRPDAAGRGGHDDLRTPGAADERDRAVPALGVRRRAAAGRGAHASPTRSAAPACHRAGAARGRGLRGGRDRAAGLRGGGALRRPVVLDGLARAAGGR